MAMVYQALQPARKFRSYLAADAEFNLTTGALTAGTSNYSSYFDATGITSLRVNVGTLTGALAGAVAQISITIKDSAGNVIGPLYAFNQTINTGSGLVIATFDLTGTSYVYFGGTAAATTYRMFPAYQARVGIHAVTQNSTWTNVSCEIQEGT